MLQKLQFRAGISREGTNYSNEGGFYSGNLVRFRSGSAEKIGGWIRLSASRYLGIARALWNWVDMSNNNNLGVGTNLKYYIERGGGYTDITPIRATFTTTATDNSLSTTVGSNVVVVTLATHGVTNNDFVTVSGATAIGGIPTADLNIEHQVRYISTNQFSFTTATAATSTVTAGGGTTIVMAFQINTGLEFYIAGNGWGAGTWPSYIVVPLANPFTASATGISVLTVMHMAHGLTTGNYVFFSSIASDPCGINRGVLQKAFSVTVTGANTYTISTIIGGNTYVTTSTSASGGAVNVDTPVAPVRGWSADAAVGIGSQLLLWSNDNYGQDLVFAQRGGAIYYWNDTTGISVRGQTLAALSTAAGYQGAYVPNTTNVVMASAIQRFIIAFGANSYIAGTPNTPFDPMLVRWSDQANPYQWVPSITNQSGEFRLSHGSYIVATSNTRQELLVWTDTALYSMQYLGPPYVWGFTLLMDNISIMSPNSISTVNNVTYWMGEGKFYQYSGRVETLPSTLRQYIFDDINLNQALQIFAGGNESYTEIWWFYCSYNSNAIDTYVIYNYLDKVWYYGKMARTAWLDSSVRDFPMAADYNNRILYHENGVDDVSGLTPVAINAYIQSSDFDIGDGDKFAFVWRILPDVNFNGSTVDKPSVKLTLLPRRNAGAPYGTANSPVVASADNYTLHYTYDVQQFDGQVYTRLRGRQLNFRIESNDVGVAWQLGVPRIDLKADGKA